MASPTWANLDFGFDNDESDNVRAFYRTQRGPIEYARNMYSFPGSDGTWIQRLGKRGRPIVWMVDLLFKSLSAKKIWEEDIEEKIDDKTYSMVLHGRTYRNVQLLSIEDWGPPQGCSLPFIGCQQYRLEFIHIAD